MDQRANQRPVEFGAVPVSAEYSGKCASGAEEAVEGPEDGQAVLLLAEDPVQGCVREDLVEAVWCKEGAGWESCGVQEGVGCRGSAILRFCGGDHVGGGVYAMDACAGARYFGGYNTVAAAKVQDVVCGC